MSVAERAIGAYLGLAVGDALGATVEFMTPREIRARHGVHRDIVGGGWLRLRAGQVTDDTTMSLALGEAILAHGRVEAQAAARAFDAWMRARPIDIGNTVRRNLIGWRHSGRPEAPPSEYDAGNGAAMRVLPVALATLGRAPGEVVGACRAQAHVTHHNPLSDAACETLVFMLHELIGGLPPDAALCRHGAALARAHPVFEYRLARRDNPGGYVVETMQAVLQALDRASGFEDALTEVVNRGGDADTTGAITGMLAGAAWGRGAIPRRWLDALDARVRERCRTQAEALVCLADTKS